MSFESFWSDLAATIAGGIALTALFFYAREKWFPLPELSGRWYFQIQTNNTAYKPYDRMVLRYVAMLWREGHTIKGTVEKIYENSSTGEREYIGKNRTRGTVEGYVEKNYIGKDKVFLHVIEDGHGRESTNIYELLVRGEDKMDGVFSSMVADQDGKASWQRKPF